MEYSYMIVAFLEPFEPEQITEPPKHAHVTIKKKFKLLDINEEQLVNLLRSSLQAISFKELTLGDTKEYGNDAYMVIEVLNASEWAGLHNQLMDDLSKNTDSRDMHFEGENYYPHVSWKVHDEITLSPEPYINTKHTVRELYLIQRIDPEISRVRVVAKLPFGG